MPTGGRWRARRWGWLLAATLVAGLLPAAHAEVHALLVGVSGYADFPLQGPRNDVRAMREALLQRGVAPARITLLADGVAGASDPTRARILAELDRLAQHAQPQDTVVLYFAGHGSQQPADRRTPAGRQEPDGLHEIFLPIDIGRWDGQQGTVRNAIVDAELRERVDRMLGRGAFVWAVFDACHAASMVRAGSGADELRFRHVSPALLGVPDDERMSPPGVATARGVGALPVFGAGPVGTPVAGAGRAVYFYASQTTERTPEMRLPRGAPGGLTQGLFTHTLLRALSQGQAISYRQLAQSVLAQYGAMQEAAATPLFSGNALDQAVLGQRQLPLRQWPVRTAGVATVPAGTLSGVAEGALFAVVPSAVADSAQVLGYFRAARVEPMQAQLEPLAHRGLAALRTADLPAGAQFRLEGSPERLALRLAVDARACGTPCRWSPVLDRLRSDGVPGADIHWSDAAPDLVLRLTREAVSAVAPSTPLAVDCPVNDRACAAGQGVSSVTPLLVVGRGGGPEVANPAQALAERLQAIARSTNLLRLAAQLALKPADQTLRVAVAVDPADGAARRPVAPEAIARARAGERLVVSLDNPGLRPVDVTLLYLDARHGISPLFPSGAGEINRLEPGARLVIDDILLSDADGVVGTERLLVIAVDAQRGAERTDFSMLAQPPVQAARARGGLQDEHLGAFIDAAFAEHRSRAAPGRVPSSRTLMQVFTVEVLAARPAAPGR